LAVAVAHAGRGQQHAGELQGAPLLLEQLEHLGAGERQRDQRVAERLHSERLAVGHVPVALRAAPREGEVGVLHAQQLVGALVELVVSDRVEIEPDLVHRLDCRFVVEERRQQRRGADEVTGREDQRVPVLGLPGPQVRGQVLGSAGGHARRRRVGGDRSGPRGLEVPVEVVEAEQLDLDVFRLRAGQGVTIL
jgi:hypothetical protein